MDAEGGRWSLRERVTSEVVTRRAFRFGPSDAAAGVVEARGGKAGTGEIAERRRADDCVRLAGG